MGREIYSQITAENVGFDLHQEAAGIAKLLNRKSSVDMLSEIAARNIRTYEAETLRDDVVSYFPYYRGYFNGERRLFRVSSDKEEDLAIATIDPAERGGAVMEGFGELENKIGMIDNRGFFVWISPRGSAGTEGVYKDINYGYHQVYIGEVTKDRTDAYALKSDVDEEALAAWVTTLSSGKIDFKDHQPETFLHNGLALETSGEMPVIERALFILKDILEKRGNMRFYKETDINALPSLIQKQRHLQEQEVLIIQKSLGTEFFRRNALSVMDVKEVIGKQLYMLYERYQDSSGRIQLKGCAGGSVTINQLLGKNGILIDDIFSTKFRLNGVSELNSNMCTECGQDANDNHYHCPKCSAFYEDETEKKDRTQKCGCGFEFHCGNNDQKKQRSWILKKLERRKRKKSLKK